MWRLFLTLFCWLTTSALAQHDALSTGGLEVWRSKAFTLLERDTEAPKYRLAMSVVVIRHPQSLPPLLDSNELPSVNGRAWSAREYTWLDADAWEVLSGRSPGDDRRGVSPRLRLHYEGGSTLELLPRRKSVWLQWKVPIF